MITRIFLPDKIGSYYLLSKQMVGIEINLTRIIAAVTIVSGRKKTVEKLIEEKIEGEAPYEQRVINGLKSLAQKIGPYDELRCVLPSSLVIFKDLTLPFTGLKKIKLVVPFEVESLLPFTLDQAVIDSIITSQTPDQTECMVAAAKIDTVAQYSSYFEAAGLKLSVLSVDMFELYALYRPTLQEADLQKTIGLVDIGLHATRIGIILQGQLKYIRVLNKGLTSIQSESSQSGAEEKQAPFSTQGFKDLFDEMVFTIVAFTQKLKTAPQPLKIVLMGAISDIPDLEKNLPSMESELVIAKPHQILQASSIESKMPSVAGLFMTSIAASSAQEITEDFTLLQEQYQKEENRLIAMQLISIGALALGLFLSFALYSFLRVRTLKVTFREAETEALTELKRSFKLKPGQSVNLTAALKAASAELKKQETTWAHLSSENRYAYLRYLRELSRCINNKESQLDLLSLYIKDDTIKLFGSVPGYQQLTKLQNQLECPLFKKLPKLQNWDFKSEPITLTVNREEL